MKSIDVVESSLKIILGPHLAKYSLDVFGWNRTKEGLHPVTKRIREGYDFMDVTNVSPDTNVGCASLRCDLNNWHRWIMRERTDVRREEAGIGMRLTPNDWTGEVKFIPMMDFNPGLNVVNRHTEDFWKGMKKEYPNQKFYLFSSGKSHHGFLNTVFDDIKHAKFLDFLRDFEIVDQKWVAFARGHYHGGVIRTTPGVTRQQPVLEKWVNL